MNNPNSIPKIVSLIKNHTANGYKLLCNDYSAVVYGSIMRVVNDNLIAEDLLRQTFQKICKNIDEYDLSSLSFLTWVLQLARSVSIDYLCVTKLQALSKNNNNLTGNVELLLIPMANEADKSINIFNMTLQGFKANEIAEKLSMSMEAVKTGIRKGMKLKVNSIG